MKKITGDSLYLKHYKKKKYIKTDVIQWSCKARNKIFFSYLWIWPVRPSPIDSLHIVHQNLGVFLKDFDRERYSHV